MFMLWILCLLGVLLLEGNGQAGLLPRGSFPIAVAQLA